MIKNHFLSLYADKEKREGRFITQKQAAQELGVTAHTVGSWLRASEKQNPVLLRQIDARTLEKICVWLSCDVGDLLTLEQDFQSEGGTFEL